IGADGWDGLSDPARRALAHAEVVLGSARQLHSLPASVVARREEWPSPLVPALPEVLSRSAGRRTCVLASGDPMFYGIGGTLIRLLGPSAVDVIVHPSSISLACARLGWAVEAVEVVSAVGRPLSSVVAALQPGRRLLVLVGVASAASSISELLVERGFGGSVMTSLSRLGATDEIVVTELARDWSGDHDPLTVVAIEARLDPGAVSYGRTPGLPDDAFQHDGQLTKQEVRSLTLSALAPDPGELLWDIGAGSGSIGIEWMRCHPANRAIGIERDPERAARAGRNAERLGVPGWQLVLGVAPDALASLPAPDAIFVGGAVSRAGVIDAALAALRPGGRLVANGVTVETEMALAGWHAKLGGTLIRVAIQRAGPVVGFTGWRPAMPVTQWSYRS
ncbi:MAG: precorrin-6Y methyltransferase, partial [Pseudonocardiales bacterium]|nr:precorrin-6Y methyltransferase [Pseudonocardiales bacterium]